MLSEKNIKQLNENKEMIRTREEDSISKTIKSAGRKQHISIFLIILVNRDYWFLKKLVRLGCVLIGICKILIALCLGHSLVLLPCNCKVTKSFYHCRHFWRDLNFFLSSAGYSGLWITSAGTRRIFVVMLISGTQCKDRAASELD
jgi:hypothetical protein